MYIYDGLKNYLATNNLNISDLTTKLNISSRTLAKINKNEKIANVVLKKIALYFDCNITDLYSYIPDNPTLRILKRELDDILESSILATFKIEFIYNSLLLSNIHVTRELIEDIIKHNTIIEKDISISTIYEINNFSKAIDYCIEVAEQPLTEEVIFNLHSILLINLIPYYEVGQYRKRELNVKFSCSLADNIEKDIAMLIKKYNSLKTIKIKDIAIFHYYFEGIHPFTDGNSRLGQLIAFKECLNYNLNPIIIKSEDKNNYYSVFQNWHLNPQGFIEYFQNCQVDIDKLKN